MKSFYEWFFKDKFVIPYPRINEGTARLGQFLTIFISVGHVIFLVAALIHDGPRVYFSVSIVLFLVPICAWFGYRIYRRCIFSVVWLVVWLVEGFSKPKE